MEVLRTPDGRSEGLPGYKFAPHHLRIGIGIGIGLGVGVGVGVGAGAGDRIYRATKLLKPQR